MSQSAEFARLVTALTDWRNADHEDALSLSRYQVITLLEGIKRQNASGSNPAAPAKG